MPIQLMGLSPTYCTIHGPSISPTRVSSAQGPCRVPATRPPGPTSRSNSPGYPLREVLPHAGDHPTLTPPLDGSDEGSTPTTIYHGAQSRAPNGPRVHCPLTPLTPPRDKCRTSRCSFAGVCPERMSRPQGADGGKKNGDISLKHISPSCPFTPCPRIPQVRPSC